MLKNDFYREIVGNDEFRGFDLLNYLRFKNSDFDNIITLGLRTGFIRKFNDLEWDKVSSIDYSMDGCFSDFLSFHNSRLRHLCQDHRYIPTRSYLCPSAYKHLVPSPGNCRLPYTSSRTVLHRNSP